MDIVNVCKGHIFNQIIHVQLNVLKNITKTIYLQGVLIVWIYVKIALILIAALHVMSNYI